MYEGSSSNHFSDILHTRCFNFVFKGTKYGHNSAIKNTGQLFFHEESLYIIQFQNSSIHRSKLSNFTENWKNQAKFQNSVLLSKFDVKFTKVNQVIYSSAPVSIPNIKALAQTVLRYFAHKIFKFCFQREITQKRGITWS